MFQDQEQHSYVKAVEIAPFATETMKTPAESSQPSRTLQDDHLEGKVRWKVEVDQEMVEKYRTKLEEKRKQVGIITTPSSELKEAEKTLAEVSLLHYIEGLIIAQLLLLCRLWLCRKNWKTGNQGNID